MELTALNCKCCTAPLDPKEAAGRVIRCKYCGTTLLLAREEEGKVADLLRSGELLLDTCKFDDAYTAYQKAAELDKEEPEAYFGMALATFKVQYLKDMASEPPRLQPICHEISEKKFTEDFNYLRACLYATEEQRKEYKKKGEEIDYILGEFFRLKQEGRDYDCFLCVKVTDDVKAEDGGKVSTEDSKDAGYIYDLLRSKGYSPFYSERELRNVTGADYEARILYALVMSECMLIVCRKESYLQTPWVKNEYTRFLKLVNDAEKESDSITVVFYGKPIEKLPGRKGKLQGIDFSLREADGKIVAFVEGHTPAARARREAEAQKKKGQEEQILRQIEEQKRAQRELEDRLSHISAASEPAAAYGARPTVSSLLKRSKQEFDRNNFADSRKYCEEALSIEPENGAAWLQRFLVETGGAEEEDQVKWNADWNGSFPAKPLDNINCSYFSEALSDAREDSYGDELVKMKKALAGGTFRSAVLYGAHTPEMREFVEKTCAALDRGGAVLDEELAGAQSALNEAQEKVETEKRRLKKLQTGITEATSQRTNAEAEIANNEQMEKRALGKTVAIGIPSAIGIGILIGIIWGLIFPNAIDGSPLLSIVVFIGMLFWPCVIIGAIVSSLVGRSRARKYTDAAPALKEKAEQAAKRQEAAIKEFNDVQKSVYEGTDFQSSGTAVRRVRVFMGIVKEREKAYKTRDEIKAGLEKVLN